MKNEISIGKNIKKYRESSNMSQDELGAKLDITGKAISSWEKGRTEPNLNYLIKLSCALKIDIDELIHGEKTSIDNGKKIMKRLQNEIGDITFSEEELSELIHFTKYILFKRKQS